MHSTCSFHVSSQDTPELHKTGSTDWFTIGTDNRLVIFVRDIAAADMLANTFTALAHMMREDETERNNSDGVQAANG